MAIVKRLMIEATCKNDVPRTSNINPQMLHWFCSKMTNAMSITLLLCVIDTDDVSSTNPQAIQWCKLLNNTGHSGSTTLNSTHHITSKYSGLESFLTRQTIRYEEVPSTLWAKGKSLGRIMALSLGTVTMSHWKEIMLAMVWVHYD